MTIALLVWGALIIFMCVCIFPWYMTLTLFVVFLIMTFIKIFFDKPLL
jgi:hypothetical protein